ncbi:MAG: peptidase domain-containing protein [Methanoregulaceae archaeon]
MKVHWLALLVVVGAMLSAPAVSGTIVEEKNGYIVTPGNETLIMPDLAAMSSSTISQGQTQSYSSYVPSGKTAFLADLNWGNPSNSLSLTITAPDARLGPYYDSADGTVDGRINLRISKSTGLASGTWWSYIYGDHVVGSQSYSYTPSLS